MLLAHLSVGAADAPKTAFVLHGILGSKENWRRFADRLAEALPSWRFVLVDLRNHGDSGRGPSPNTLDVCAEDLKQLAEFIEVRPAAVVGHSFGGKVALAYAASHPTLDGVWVLDSDLGTSEAGLGGEVEAVIEALEKVELPIPSRQSLVDTLTSRGLSRSLALWMTTNLRSRTENGPSDGLVWRFDLPSVKEMLADYRRTDMWPFLESDGRPDVTIVVAAESNSWTADCRRRASELDTVGAITLEILPNAGHWLHVDNPGGLADLLAEGLDSAGRKG